ncbi:expressed protein [Chlorella variabilis]|uniref:Expressed protein n=1 Tax=Chlorella variabilis TaxID=554065 RepID=E1Z5C1_CHLVA|nr:expressed protein [Chlorella variabilis]EFN59500.1 expressed protein [Chlorella variabilis]|eukprot:XP_005851602.1 expressed protein [Chlorella variabilis]
MDEDEATRLGVLERLQATGRPATAEDLASSLGIPGRVVVGLMERLVAQGVAEEVPANSSQSPTYRLVQPRRRARNGSGGVQPKVGRPGPMHSPTAAHQAAQQHPYMAGMVPYGYAPYHGQQVLYYPAGMAPFQQQPMPAGAPQWHRPGMPGGARPQQQQAGGGPAGGMGVGPIGVAGPQHMGYPMQPYYYAAAGAPMPLPSNGQPRPAPMPRAASGSSGSTGWGGVPLSQSSAEVMVGAVPSPRSTQSMQSAQELPPAGSSQELPLARSRAASSGVGDKEEPAVVAAALAAAEGQAREAVAVVAVAQQAAAAAEPESASQAGPSSTEGGSEEDGDAQQLAGSVAAGSISSSGGEGAVAAAGSGRRTGSSSGGSSGGSRRSRGSRERQPCAFFLKTGTCAYGDSCKFAHPFDKAPKVDCAFGHTCKFHHPELPPGGPTAVPAMYAMQYHVQYQQTASSPMLTSLLGLKPGHGGASPMSASPSGPGPVPGYYMAAPPYPGGPHAFPGRPPAMHPVFSTSPAGMPGAQMLRGPTQRPQSGGSKTGPAMAAAAAAAGSMGPVPVPVPLAAAQRPDSARAAASEAAAASPAPAPGSICH